MVPSSLDRVGLYRPSPWVGHLVGDQSVTHYVRVLGAGERTSTPARHHRKRKVSRGPWSDSEGDLGNGPKRGREDSKGTLVKESFRERVSGHIIHTYPCASTRVSPRGRVTSSPTTERSVLSWGTGGDLHSDEVKEYRRLEGDLN